VGKANKAKELADKYEIKITPIPEKLGGGYEASIPELGSYAFVGDGDSRGEALENLEVLAGELLQEYSERGETVPQPRILDQEYSGKFVVRMPKSLHRALAEAAEQDGVSLNQLVTYLLSGALTLKHASDHNHRLEKKLDFLTRHLTERWALVEVSGIRLLTGLPDETAVEEAA